MPLTITEETRLHELEEKNSKDKCSDAELNELQHLLDKYYGWIE